MGSTAADVVVVGGGHNGLVAAILAAQAGRSVVLLERSDQVGGATVSQTVFPPHPARLSRYSYLVSLFPAELADRLGVRFTLLSRDVASYTPVQRNGRASGLLIERVAGPATEESFADLTGSGSEFRAWVDFYGAVAAVAAEVAPTLLGPLQRRSEVRDRVVAAAGARIWDDLVEAPLGEAITQRFADDTVRGVVATDGLIGTHTSLFAPERLANRCFLYHLIGRGTGEWLVPRGGMGAVTAALLDRAREVGVEIVTGVDVRSVAEDRDTVTVTGHRGDVGAEWVGTHLLAAVAPAVLDRLRGRPSVRPVGAQIKVNLLLDRLPTLASGADPRLAFAGTTHLEEGFDQLETAYRRSASGRLPNPLPAEIYCHSLTDPSILQGRPGATLTLFGLHTPVDLFDADPEGTRTQAVERALAALQVHLAEPLEECLARDGDGRLCIDAASPIDLEHSLGMSGGNIFHDDLSWPWLADDEAADTAAQRFGVAVADSSRILLAGAGTRRGGGVSGLGGAAAVDALLAG